MRQSTGALVAVDEKGVAFELAGELSPNEICVHEDCLLWSPEVHFTKGRFMNVQKELRRSGGLYCTVCGGRGAALGCRVPACRHTYHVPCARRTPGCHFDEDAYVLSCPQHPPVGAKPKKLKRKQPSPPAAAPHADESDEEEEAGNAQDARRGKEDARAPPVAGKNQRRARTGAGGRGAGAGGRKASAQGSDTVAPEVPVKKDVTTKGAVKDVTMKDVTMKGVAAMKSKYDDMACVAKASAPIAKVPVTKDGTMKGVTMKDDAAVGKKTEESVGKERRSVEREVNATKKDKGKGVAEGDREQDTGRAVILGVPNAMAPCSSSKRGHPCPNDLSPKALGSVASVALADDAPTKLNPQARVTTKADSEAVFKVPQPVVKVPQPGASEKGKEGEKGEKREGGKEVREVEAAFEEDIVKEGRGKEIGKKNESAAAVGAAAAAAAATAVGGAEVAVSIGASQGVAVTGGTSSCSRNSGKPPSKPGVTVTGDAFSCSRSSSKPPRYGNGMCGKMHGGMGPWRDAAADGAGEVAVDIGASQGVAVTGDAFSCSRNSSKPPRYGNGMCGATGLWSDATAAGVGEVAVGIGATQVAAVTGDGSSCSRNSGKPPSQWVLCGSALDSASKARLVKFANAMGAQLTSEWSPRVTHLLVGTDSEGKARRTLKMVMAILHGQWVLSSKWLPSSPTAASPTDGPAEGPFEVLCDSHDESGGATRGRLHYAPMAKGCPSPPPLFASITAVFLEGGFATPSFADVASILQCGGGTVIPSSALHSPTAKTLLAAFSNPSNNTPTASAAAAAAPAAPADIRKDEDRSQGCQRHGETKILLVVYADVPANTPLVSGKMRRELALVEKRREAARQLWKEVGARACVTHNWIVDSAAGFELKAL
ncbi:unnamed protein product [Closterium sp. Naga37s-1]|nr:unnamed protein product [Closterium sp. Naga37s-1]